MLKCLFTNMFLCLFGGTIFLGLVESYVNIALNKPAWQDDDFFNFTANKAVDGRKSSLTVYGKECVNSDLKNTTEWRVDLENILSIHHVLIQFATDTKDSDKNNKLIKKHLGFSVYLSNTTIKEEGILCFRDSMYTSSTLPSPVTIPCPHYGRYVIYYNNRTHPPYPAVYSNTTGSFLCEVEVYGCPVGRNNGDNCSKQCPQNCLNDQCDIVKGTCVGCHVGYTGLYCESRITKTQYELWFGWAAFGTIVLTSAVLLALNRRNVKSGYLRSLKIPARNAHIISEDEYPPQNISTHARQGPSEDFYSNYNETAYNEPFEMTNNYSSLQSWYPYADNGYDLNTYSYNHLHEKALYLTPDAYDVVEPMFLSPVSTDESSV